MTTTRKLIVKADVSLDGYGADAYGRVSVLTQDFGDPRVREAQLAVLRQAGAHLMGRRAYEEMSPYWPTATGELAAAMNDLPKFVYSRSLAGTESPWQGTTFMGGDFAAEIGRLKADAGGTDAPLLAHGGPTFLGALAAHGLVDRYHLFVHARTLGTGTPLFRTPARFDVVESTAYDGGIVGLTLEPVT